MAREICIAVIEHVYIPGMRHFWSEGWYELEGMSQGSGIHIAYLMLLNTVEDLAAIRNPQSQDVIQSTSAFFSRGATASHTPVLAHSWSAPKQVHDEDLIVYLDIQYPFLEGFKSIFMVTEAGMISGDGMSSDGLAVTGNRLISTDDTAPGHSTPCFPVTCLERYLLEWDVLNDARDPCGKLPRHASKHLLVANSNGFSTSLEMSPKSAHVHYGELGTKTKLHTNHFQSFTSFQYRRQSMDRYRGVGSRSRLYRLKGLIAEQGQNGITEKQIREMFSDHEDVSESICHHREDNQDNMTVAFVMYDTKRKVISVCKGPPCQGQMMHLTFEEGGGARVDASDGRDGGASSNPVREPQTEQI